MAITSANQLELLQTAEAVAREKMIEPELVIQAMEDSLARAAKSRYGNDMDIRVNIDRKTGRATFARIRTVVEDDGVENHHAQLTVKQAKDHLKDPVVGDEIIDEVPPVDLGRIAAQFAQIPCDNGANLMRPGTLTPFTRSAPLRLGNKQRTFWLPPWMGKGYPWSGRQTSRDPYGQQKDQDPTARRWPLSPLYLPVGLGFARPNKSSIACLGQNQRKIRKEPDSPRPLAPNINEFGPASLKERKL